MTRNELVQSALSVARAGKRAGGRSSQIELRERVAATIRPHMGGRLQWLVSPRQGESERAFARRAAEHAATRAGIADAAPDDAILTSVEKLIRKS